MPSDWQASDSIGTSKKLQPRVQLAIFKPDHDVTAALERTGVEYCGGPDFIDRRGFVDMPRDADLGLDLLDKAARRRAAYRRPVHQPVALGLMGRRMTDHHQRPPPFDLAIAAAQRVVDLVLGKFSWGVKGRDVGAAAAEQRDPVHHYAAPVQRDAL